ncbi:MAG: hypothetical protein JWQ74_320 [Marmoricola sp.]|nr:hypothetical protein [Marmoricola sp.]
MNALPRRPVLAPGLAVLVRAPGELQIGRSDRHRLVVADSPAVRRTLAVLGRGETPPGDDETRQVLDELAPVLRDGDALVRPGLPPAEVAAIALRHPASAEDRLGSRRSARIWVLGDWSPDPSLLLASSGLASSGLASSGLASDSGPTKGATVALVLCHGDLDRHTSDALVRSRVPHLLLRAVESEIILGPFVGPGATACLRCLDAHQSDEDPSYRAPTPAAVRYDGVPAPCDSALGTVALGWAVGDLVRYVEGDLPTTWSATVTFTPGQTSVDAVPWSRHPACGCSWADEPAWRKDPSVMMGA